MARQPQDYPPIMDTAMVGELLQMSPVHVRRLARDGVIPAYRIEGVRAFKFKRDEILGWFEAQRVDSTAATVGQSAAVAGAEQRMMVSAGPYG